MKAFLLVCVSLTGCANREDYYDPQRNPYGWNPSPRGAWVSPQMPPRYKKPDYSGMSDDDVQRLSQEKEEMFRHWEMMHEQRKIRRELEDLNARFER